MTKNKTFPLNHSLPFASYAIYLAIHTCMCSGGSRGGSLGNCPPKRLWHPVEWRPFAINAPLFGAHGSRNRDKKYSKINNFFA